MPDDSSTTPAESGGIWRGLRALLFGDEGDETLRARLEEVIDAHEGDPAPDSKGDLTPLERQMVRNLLHFGERDAGDVGVPRADIVAVEEAISFDDLVKAFAEAGHSRLPVYEESLDQVIGMVHIKDVFTLQVSDAEPPADIAALLRKPLYVPESMGVLDLLARMRAERVHLAIVVDEFGGTEGLLTIEDIVEEIVGEIEDEHDDAEAAMLTLLEDGVWEADARIELEELAEAVDRRLSSDEDEVDTLGGLIFLIAGHIPAKGECVTHPSGWKLEAVDSDPRRIIRVRLHAPEDEKQPD